MDSFKIKLILEVFRTMVTIDNDQWEREMLLQRWNYVKSRGHCPQSVFIYIVNFFIVYLVKI